MIQKNPQDRILSFDPGETTGICILIDGDPVLNMTASVRAFLLPDILSDLVKIAKPTIILVEKPPVRAVNADQQFVYNRILGWFAVAGIRTIAINPGQWKNFIDRSNISSTHMRDAADMARWFYTKHSRSGDV